MKKLAPKLVLIAFCISLSTVAQENHERTYSEEFNTNSDVTIDVDTRYTDVIIETWNKNKVEISATILIEGVSKENAERTLENWKFKALGNKSMVEISSRNSNLLIGRLNNNLHADLLDNLPQFIENDDHILRTGILHNNLALLNLDRINIVMDSMTWPKLESFSFDYEKFKNDQNYLKEWQKSFEKNGVLQEIELEKLAENAKKIVETFEKDESKAKHLEDLKKHMEDQKLHMKDRLVKLEKALKKRQEAYERKVIVKGKLATTKNDHNRIIVNGYPTSSNKNYAIVRALESREKTKIKRTIVIKAPKGAKFKMNVKYGEISFPK